MGSGVMSMNSPITADAVAVAVADAVADSRGRSERHCSWCGERFHARRRDAHLCSPQCRTAASRYATLRAALALRAIEVCCASCGGALAASAPGRQRIYCSDSCRQRQYRQRKAEGSAFHSATSTERTIRSLRVCAGPSCAIVITSVGRPGRPREYCSSRCRSAQHRATSASRNASNSS